MVTCILILLLILMVDIAALRWGMDSRDGPDSPEWRRRGSWFLPVDHARPAGYSSKEAYLYLYRRSNSDERTS